MNQLEAFISRNYVAFVLKVARQFFSGKATNLFLKAYLPVTVYQYGFIVNSCLALKGVPVDDVHRYRKAFWLKGASKNSFCLFASPLPR